MRYLLRGAVVDELVGVPAEDLLVVELAEVGLTLGPRGVQLLSLVHQLVHLQLDLQQQQQHGCHFPHDLLLVAIKNDRAQ